MDRAREYAGNDEDFAEWLHKVDRIVESQILISLFDLESMLLRDSYDAGDTPEDCVMEVVAETVYSIYGSEMAEILTENLT